jgi:flagellar FliL protein
VSPRPTDAGLDSSIEIAADASQTLPKVQLDIDDAPFLREKAPEAPPPAPMEDDRSPAPLEVPLPLPAGGGRRKKKIIIGVAVLLLLLLAGGGAGWWWFKIRIPPPPPPPPPKPQVVVVPSTPPDSGPAESLIAFAPFWLELTSDSPRGKDKIFFLVCKFTAITKSEATLQEAQNKNIILRDALYFYLKNKPYDFLISADNTPVIKNDLISVINGYLTGNNKVDDVLFERYVSK